MERTPPATPVIVQIKGSRKRIISPEPTPDNDSDFEILASDSEKSVWLGEGKAITPVITPKKVKRTMSHVRIPSTVRKSPRDHDQTSGLQTYRQPSIRLWTSAISDHSAWKELSKIVQHQVATGADGTVRSAKYAQKFILDGKAKWGTVKPGSRTGGGPCQSCSNHKSSPDCLVKIIKQVDGTYSIASTCMRCVVLRHRCDIYINPEPEIETPVKPVLPASNSAGRPSIQLRDDTSDLSDVPDSVSPRPPKIKLGQGVKKIKVDSKAAPKFRDPKFMVAITTTLGFVELMREPLTQNAELGLGPATMFKAVTIQLELLKKAASPDLKISETVAQKEINEAVEEVCDFTEELRGLLAAKFEREGTKMSYMIKTSLRAMEQDVELLKEMSRQ